MTITIGFDGTVYSVEPIAQESPEVRTDYRNSTYNIVSKVGYLIGFPNSILSLSRELSAWSCSISWTRTRTPGLSGTCACCGLPLS